MKDLKRKQIAAEYKQTYRQMGVYQLKNRVNGKILIGSSMDLEGAFNRLRFTLKYGADRNKDLVGDWQEYGESNFIFEILEQIKPEEESVTSVEELRKYKEELPVLEQMWLDQLQPYGERGYNKKPIK